MCIGKGKWSNIKGLRIGVEGDWYPVGRGHVIEKKDWKKRSQNMFSIYLPAWFK
jgi:hypothetical protein